MLSTEDLIGALAAEARPVRRLAPPLLRALLWLFLAAAVVVLVTVIHGARPNLAAHFAEPEFRLALAGSLLTAILATLSAFQVSLPDRSSLWLALPLPGLAIWLSAIGYGCLTNWIPLSQHVEPLGAETRCAAIMVLTSLPLGLAMLAMLRATHTLRPSAAALCGGLAVAAVIASAMPFFHDHDAAALTLAWNLGPMLLILMPAAAFSRRLVGGRA